MPYYINPQIMGIQEVVANNDGYTVSVEWATAYPTLRTNKIGYFIYFSDDEEKLFYEGPKFFAKGKINKADIVDLIPGQRYWFAVRSVEYDTSVDVTSLPKYSDNLYVIPATILARNIDDVVTTIPLMDVVGFPSYGVVRIGAELIRYTSIDTANNLLLFAVRGYGGSAPTIHNTDGYDGVITRDPSVVYYLGTEEKNNNSYQGQCRFDIDHYSYTVNDGYKQVTTDLLTADFTSSDESNVNFPTYDYTGYHRTDPIQLLNGECVGSYIGGEYYCADSTTGVGNVLRGMSVQEQNNQRQEMLLSVTGEPVVLLSRQRTGYRCKCFLPLAEHPDDRCQFCLGSGVETKWQQYFNPRRSDSRILIRFGPTEDSLKTTETGLESESFFDCWGLTVPTIKNRDIIVRFDQNDNEEYRYEVLGVNRNRMLQSLMGGQKFRLQRIRKTDPVYQIPVFRNTSKLPSKIYTSIASGPEILPHRHIITINENVVTVEDINQTTGIAASHSHFVRAGTLEETLGHSHTIIIP